MDAWLIEYWDPLRGDRWRVLPADQSPARKVTFFDLDEAMRVVKDMNEGSLNPIPSEWRLRHMETNEVILADIL